jgi:hypothetical protein
MRIVRTIAIWTLALLGIGAIGGGVFMILDPASKVMGMPHRFLDHSPFQSFLIPGIILLLANGVLPLLIMFAAMRRSPGYGWWVAFQGCVLIGWISVEVVMLRVVDWPHYLYWAVGLMLIVSGLVLRREGRTV